MSVLVAGSLHLDVIMRAPHLPGLDETVAGSAVDYVFGGKGGNQAIAAARMGAAVCFAGRAGSDGFGDIIRKTLAASSIDLTQLQRDSGASGMSAAIIDKNGDYGAVIVSAANLRIAQEELHIPQGASLVLLQNEVPEAVNLDMALKAKQAGAQVWLNAAPARVLPEPLVDALDLLIVNQVEAEFYANQMDACDTLTTIGKDGVSYQGVRHAGFRVDVVSTHGAGDMFVGALAAQVDRGHSIVQAIDFAQSAAALHVGSDAAAREGLEPDHVREFLAVQSNL